MHFLLFFSAVGFSTACLIVLGYIVWGAWKSRRTGAYKVRQVRGINGEKLRGPR